MSSSSPTSTSSVSQSTETESTSQGSSTTNEGNLYLFTFLSTLLVLLIISCSIVFRSFVLRRRYQRRLAEALATGAVLAPRAQGSHKKRFRTRPKFFETWLSDAEKSSTWADLMPVSALTAKTKRKTKETEQIRAPADTRSETVSQRLFASYLSLRDSHFRFGRRSTHGNSDSSDSSTPRTPGSPDLVTPVQEKTNPFSTPTSQKNVVQVAVLVAMPSPSRLSAIPYQKEPPLPEVMFGVTRLHLRDSQSDS
ncbi:hypothetical protein F5890DRAFT_1046717 [Lentinula detonsa]|uniref:Transmembrane protein n=1 Tax=Lentinula detonsa TaxID=2804962 RepID=A0AA38QAP8_9AGAR|nr:hypothetical protein F5890DRAFT_1046717 [Lentinula detonsa]